MCQYERQCSMVTREESLDSDFPVQIMGTETNSLSSHVIEGKLFGLLMPS